MLRKFLNKKASSVLEYMALLVVIMAAFIVIQQYLVRAFSGKWKQAGDTFGFEQQYDPRGHDLTTERGTRECFYAKDLGLWINTRCFRQNCDCREKHEFPATTVPPDPSLVDICTPCMLNCSQNNPTYADCADDVN